ncbi:glycosyltransferase [Halorarum salinum]|uniref:Glycosyltransferase n=1 Tax=Halorarum salinum TaxID=2743089 RepID=A0A7D5L8B4_9EURY|nr:glycosyltransferase [Halobaculum salinum]QLG60428.1 glycosyltransferase [Halobaculum salinum]
MSRVLLFARELPHPPNAGDRIVTFGFVRALAERGHEVHVLAYSREGDDGDAAALREECASVRRVPRPDRGLPAPLWKATQHFRGRSHVMATFDSAAFRAAAADRVRDLNPDAVLAQHPYMGQVFRDDAVASAIESAGARRVTNAHVVEYLAHERRREYAEGLRTHVALTFEIPRLRGAERAVYEASDRTLVLGETDRRELGSSVHGLVTTQRVALDPDRYDPAAADDEVPGRLLFFGSYDWFPNADAITHICEEAFPAVRRAHPDAELLVAGRDAPPAVRALGERPSVEFVGEVDDLGALVRTASAIVAPIRVRGGVRIKVLESMAWEVPVVTTPAGVEGIEATPGEDLLVADGADALADATVGVLEDRERRRAMARNARETVRKRYSVGAVAA